MLSKKSKSSEKITLVEDENVVHEDESNANFQIYFFQMQLNLEIPEFSDINLLAERSSHPIFEPQPSKYTCH